MKVGNVPNVSLPPVKTCGNCSACIHKCYDIKACMQYENVMKARARNYSILIRNFRLYLEQLREKLSHMIKSARMFPSIVFWTYTKSHGIVNEFIRNRSGNRRKAIPKNLSIMFSVWAGKPIENPYDFPVFYVFEHGQEKPEMFMCPSNCKWCIEHHRGCPYGESSCIEEH